MKRQCTKTLRGNLKSAKLVGPHVLGRLGVGNLIVRTDNVDDVIDNLRLHHAIAHCMRPFISIDIIILLN